jgi:hypothetical protein
VQTFIRTGRQVAPHTMGVRVLLLTGHAEGSTGQRLASYGSMVDTHDDWTMPWPQSWATGSDTIFS